VSEQLEQLLVHEELIGTLAEVFGGLALLLASVGLVRDHGVFGGAADQRNRVADGSRRHARTGGVADSGRRAGAGGHGNRGGDSGGGGGRAAAGQPALRKASAPAILGAPALILGACATVAGIVPAARAGSVDPVRALRVEN